MSDPLGINFNLLDPFANNVRSFANYFEPAQLMSTPNCSWYMNDNANSAFLATQKSVDLLGDLLNLESEKLSGVSSSFKYLENTLSELYNPG
ncbi:MAG: hypothetical protein J6U54_10455 [Clostridiales bacterium]|nr:hypothetical protein [Clostridiales bacterium]